VTKTGLAGTDRLLGVVFGVARGAFIVAILVLFAGLTPMPQDAWWHDSRLLGYFQEFALWMRDYLPKDMAENISYV
jgi:membrane protein required for colicin V production